MPRSRTDRLLDLLARQAEELARFEREAAERTGEPYRIRMGEITREAVRRWVLIVGGLDLIPTPGQVVRLQAMLVELVGRIATVPIPDLGAVAREAVRIGLRHGMEQAGQGSGRSPLGPDEDLPDGLPDDLIERVNGVPDRIEAQIEVSRRLARGMPAEPTPADRDLILATAGRVRSIVERETAVLVTRGASAGISTVAGQAGLSTVWVPERDACLACLAYAGRVSDGTGFPAGLTFAVPPRPIGWAVRRGRVPGPPLHPRCRCQLSVWSADWHDRREIPLPDALAREARRSVVLGFALPSESEPARRRAADELLDAGTGLPRTVVERARRRVRARGRFTRPVP